MTTSQAPRGWRWVVAAAAVNVTCWAVGLGLGLGGKVLLDGIIAPGTAHDVIGAVAGCVLFWLFVRVPWALTGGERLTNPGAAARAHSSARRAVKLRSTNESMRKLE